MQRPNGVPACASCKHQKKKCTETCILAPFFPVEKTREFQAVHKVFGVSNVAKTLKNLNNQEDRKRAADSLIWEAFCWQRNPLDGPYGEHKRVFEELKWYKIQYLNQLQVCKVAPAPALVGWNNQQNGGFISSIRDNGNSGIDHVQNMEKQWPENDNHAWF